MLQYIMLSSPQLSPWMSQGSLCSISAKHQYDQWKQTEEIQCRCKYRENYCTFMGC